MKKFVIINGKDLHLFYQDSLKDAIIYAQNYMNHSEEVIVREISNIHNTSKVS